MPTPDDNKSPNQTSLILRKVLLRARGAGEKTQEECEQTVKILDEFLEPYGHCVRGLFALALAGCVLECKHFTDQGAPYQAAAAISALSDEGFLRLRGENVPLEKLIFCLRLPQFNLFCQRFHDEHSMLAELAKQAEAFFKEGKATGQQYLFDRADLYTVIATFLCGNRCDDEASDEEE